MKEVDPRKQLVLLLNKSELLSELQRKYWAKYFRERNVRILFWSAYLAMEELKAEREREMELLAESESDDELTKQDEAANPRKTQKRKKQIRRDLTKEKEEGKDSDDGIDSLEDENEEEEEEEEGKEGEGTEEGDGVERKNEEEMKDVEDHKSEKMEEEEKAEDAPVPVSFQVSVDEITSDSVKILSRKELYDELVAIAMPVSMERRERERKEREASEPGDAPSSSAKKGKSEQAEDEEEKNSIATRHIIGMVGYPNVGKRHEIENSLRKYALTLFFLVRQSMLSLETKKWQFPPLLEKQSIFKLFSLEMRFFFAIAQVHHFHLQNNIFNSNFFSKDWFSLLLSAQKQTWCAMASFPSIKWGTTVGQSLSYANVFPAQH